MQIPVLHSKKKRNAQLLLLALPTALVMGYVVYVSDKWLSVFEQPWELQTISFILGMATALFVFAHRLRFVTLTALLLLLFAIIKAMAQWVQPQEFDAFFFLVKANNYLLLFFVGWLAGFGFSRNRFFSAIWSIFLLAIVGLVSAFTIEPKTINIIGSIAPVLLYSLYIIYTSELIRNMNPDQQGFGWFVTRRLGGFLLAAGLIGIAVFFFLRSDIEYIEKTWEKRSQTPKEDDRQGSLTRNDGMGTATNPSMGLQGFNNRANKDSLVFVAKLDHFFADGVTPNPLYFVSDYYTYFDTLTQTFETDTLRPYNDLYQPDLTTMPLYFNGEDTSVLRQTMAVRNTITVTAEIYKKSLSPRYFIAPSTAFFVQPISVPPENKDIYKSAYRTKMEVSDLNSAYFVYNPAGDIGLSEFQEQRFSLLRQVEDYQLAPEDFMAYYTKMPRGTDYDSIGLLANNIIEKAGATAPVDKIIAIRDYFLATDSMGQPTYKYSDNPGIPGIPSANKLCYFLFQNKRGYCAYYAGATLFLLRSLGIPSRIATGFLTVDRSSKNPGWYWFYEDQAHAWVQAWFPGFGWLDFDTTVPSTESQEAPQPDQTPPLTSQKAWLVANGSIISVDTLAGTLRMMAKQMLYWDNPYELIPTQNLPLDFSMATILKDTGVVDKSNLLPGIDIVAVSFSEQFKNLPPKENEPWISLLKRMPKPLPIDEIKIIAPVSEDKAQAKGSGLAGFSWKKAAGYILLTLFVLGIILLLVPISVFSWYVFKAKRTSPIRQKAYYTYMASMLYLHQLGYKKTDRTPLQFAKEEIDPRFQTHFERFAAVYQKIKYSRQTLTASEEAVIFSQQNEFLTSVKKQLTLKKRFISFLNPATTIEFFTEPNILGSSFQKQR